MIASAGLVHTNVNCACQCHLGTLGQFNLWDVIGLTVGMDSNKLTDGQKVKQAGSSMHAI